MNVCAYDNKQKTYIYIYTYISILAVSREKTSVEEKDFIILE